MFLKRNVFQNAKISKGLRGRLFKMNVLIVFVFLFINPLIVYAQVHITEVMYNLEGSDTGREWVEIYNSTDSDINLDGWKLYENDTNHRIEPLEDDGNIVLSSYSYAIIAEKPSVFKTDWPNFGGTLFDSAFSLKNTQETIILRNAELSDVSEVSYAEHPDIDEHSYSLQKIGANWSPATPTPGKENSRKEVEVEQSTQTKEKDTSNNSSSSQNPEPAFPSDKQQIYTNAGSDKEVIAGAGFFIEGEALGTQKKPLKGADYTWNFGDGSTGSGKKVMHHYDYPDKYVVFLRVSSGGFCDLDRVIIDVFPAELKISKANSDFIELTNALDKELDISMWHLRVRKEHFSFPKNTIILPNSNIRFSSSITGLKSKDGKASLLYPNGKIATSSMREIKKEKTKEKEKVSATQSLKDESSETKKNLKETKKDSVDLTNAADFTNSTNSTNEDQEAKQNFNISKNSASAIDSLHTSKSTKNEKSSESKWLFALLGFVSVSSISALSYHKKMKEKKLKAEELENKETDFENPDIEIIE